MILVVVMVNVGGMCVLVVKIEYFVIEKLLVLKMYCLVFIMFVFGVLDIFVVFMWWWLNLIWLENIWEVFFLRLCICFRFNVFILEVKIFSFFYKCFWFFWWIFYLMERCGILYLFFKEDNRIWLLWCGVCFIIRGIWKFVKLLVLLIRGLFYVLCEMVFVIILKFIIRFVIWEVRELFIVFFVSLFFSMWKDEILWESLVFVVGIKGNWRLVNFFFFNCLVLSLKKLSVNWW